MTIIRRVLLALGLAAFFAGPAVAQPTITQDRVEPQVVLETGMGRIVIELDMAEAPVTGANFLAYVDQGRLDGTVFYRAMTGSPGTGLIQGGTNNDPQRVLPPIAHEPTTQTGLSHIDGAVSMARWEPGTATGDFTIMVGDNRYLNAHPGDPGDNAGYAVFAHVIEGMNVVRAILAAPKSPTEGEGVMLGQMLDPRIVITSARRL